MADEEITRISHITNQALGFYREATAPVEVHSLKSWIAC